MVAVLRVSELGVPIALHQCSGQVVSDFRSHCVGVSISLRRCSNLAASMFLSRLSVFRSRCVGVSFALRRCSSGVASVFRSRCVDVPAACSTRLVRGSSFTTFFM